MTDEFRRAVEELQAALTEYGDHRSGCSHWRPWLVARSACDCGFSDALALGRAAAGLADGTSVKSPGDSSGTDAESPIIEEHEQLARDLDGADQAGLLMMDEIAELRRQITDLRDLLAPLWPLVDAARLREPIRAGREDMQSYDAYTGEPFTNLYADDPDGEWHLGERLPETVARALGVTNKQRAALIVALVNTLPALRRLVEGRT